jgi:hypothetical protein
MKKSLFRSRGLRLVLTAGLLAVGLMISPLALHQAGASLSSCAGCHHYGPKITVSNGWKITTGVGVTDSSQGTLGVSYTVHVPSGVTVTTVTYQGSAQVPQSAQVIADGNAGTVDVTTNVTTGATGVAVYPFTTINNQNTSCISSNSTSGFSNQDVLLQTLSTC